MLSKLGVGPMSSEIIDAIVDYSNEKQRPLMIIASRNQIDADTGYVMTTPTLANLLKSKTLDNIFVCRDHCGPYFLDSEKSLSLQAAIEATKKTISYDIEQGFDLIHIDTSRVNENAYKVAEELINFALRLNPNIMFEFGTEENIGVVAGIQKYKEDVAFAKSFPNMKFVVAQTGSLCFEDNQAGTFDFDIVKDLVEYANSSGIGLKEHNADYLNHEQLQLRKLAGVHAVNIAPQLGVVQTKLLRRLSKNRGLGHLWEQFAQLVVDSGKWSKWTDSVDVRQKVIVSGHYCFASDEYRNLVEELNTMIDYRHYLKKEIFKILDLYTENL